MAGWSIVQKGRVGNERDQRRTRHFIYLILVVDKMAFIDTHKAYDEESRSR